MPVNNAPESPSDLESSPTDDAFTVLMTPMCRQECTIIESDGGWISKRKVIEFIDSRFNTAFAFVEKLGVVHRGFVMDGPCLVCPAHQTHANFLCPMPLVIKHK